MKLAAGYDFVNVLVRGGSIVPYQDALEYKVRRTEALKHLPMEIIVTPDHPGNAAGTLMIDDESAPNPIETEAYRYYSFTFSQMAKLLRVSMKGKYKKEPTLLEFFSTLTILGAEDWKDVTSACIISEKKGQKIPIYGRYVSTKFMLTFSKSDINIAWSDIDSIIFDSKC